MRKIICLSVLVLSAGALAQASAVDRQIQAALTKSKAPGVSVIAVKSGKVVFEKGFGLANVEHQAPMADQSVHELASVSKQFTAAAILLLDQDEKLKVTDRLSKHFPDQGKAWEDVTILQLLQHTSGLPDYLGALGDMGSEWSSNQMVDSIGDKPLDFSPGSKWAYSNSGYMILGVIVQKSSGMSLEAFLKKRIFDPLGMRSSCLNNTRRIVPHRADGYEWEGGRLVKEGFTSESLSSTGDGEVMSTAGDLWRWTDGLHHGRVLDAEHYRLMTTATKQSVKAGFGYGCGIGVEDKPGGKIFSHSGGWLGTSTSVTYDSGKEYFCAVLCNMGNVDTSPFEAILDKNFNK